MVSKRSLIAAALLGLIALDAHAADKARPPLTPTRVTAPTGPVAIAARDPHGAPSLLWSPSAPPTPAWLSSEAAARLHLERHRDAYGISRAVVTGARRLYVHDLGRGGSIVAFRPTVGGVDVMHADVKVLLDARRRPLAISGTPHPAAHAGAALRFQLDDAAAVAHALRQFTPHPHPLTRTASAAGWTRFALADRSLLRVPARARPIYHPLGGSLVPAYFVELQLQTPAGLDVQQLTVAADDGRVLMRRSATASESYQYRVWADVDGDHRPADGPLVDWTPHPTGQPDVGPVDAAAPVLITMEGFNTNPDGLADPWLPPGAGETRGNNVDAYVDHNAPNHLDDTEFRATTTAPGVFDRAYDVTLPPLASQAQSMASITQLFYVTNWMHDYWYDSGFTEATGNAQADNFGRGGMDGDPMLAEAQDAANQGARNNANMSTPQDGASPVMQMYLWTGLSQLATLELDPLDAAFDVGLAVFGPQNYDITGPLVLVEDTGDKSPTDGCQAPVNDVAGKIVLVDRGNCTFETKVTFAQEAGALGVVIADNLDTPTAINPGNDAKLDDPVIPAQGTTQAAGAALKAALQQSPQTAHMAGETSVERDGTIDDMIVAHEWGHYIHHRLVDCGSRSCGAQSEGWGDFNAIFMALREGDDLDGVYAGDTYAGFDTTGYFGIRRLPYTVDFARNALTYAHIADGNPLPADQPIDPSGNANSETHNAGEIWATMMWEVYIALHKAHAGDLDFTAVRRLMADYVVAGMMLAPTSPTFLEQRDAILMAAAARDPADFDTIAAAFARRGAGSCAVSPERSSIDFVGVKEDFQLRASGVLLTASIDDGDASCDDDGVVDVGELGRVDFEVYNTGAAPLPPGARVEVADPDAALVFPDGASFVVPGLAPLEKTSGSIPVAIAAINEYRPLTLTLRLITPGGCVETSDRPLPTVIQADLLPESSALDEVEVPDSPWTIDGGDGSGVWRRLSSAESGWYWHADDVGRPTDTRLVSPTLEVSQDKPLILSFDHAYSFETSDGIFWDGAVIEVLRPGEKQWVDISTLAAVTGYNGVIASEANPLNARSAYVGASKGYPARTTESLNLGKDLAGEKIIVRLRVGTDAAAGGPGWDIDNIRVDGLANTPFPTWQVDQALCSETGGPGTDTAATTSADDTAADDTAIPTTDPAPTTDLAPTTDAPTTTTDPGELATDDDGCGCTSAPRNHALPGLLLLLGLRRRRARA